MRKTNYFYETVCDYFEDTLTSEQLKSSLEPQFADKGPGRNIKHTYQSIVTNTSSFNTHDSDLIRCSSDTLRQTITAMLGFEFREADRLLYGKHMARSAGRESKAPISIRDHDTALRTSALLETPLSVLLTSKPKPAPTREHSWFYHFSEIDMPRLKKLFALKNQYEIFEIGRFRYDDLQNDIGVAILRLPGFSQVSFWVDHFPHVSKSKWEERLVGFALDCGIAIGKSPIYSVVSPILSSNEVRIYRLCWLTHDTPRERVRLYTRMFSPRVEEVSFIVDMEEGAKTKEGLSSMLVRRQITIKRPLESRADVLTACQSYLFV